MANAKFSTIDDSIGTLFLWQVVATYTPQDSRQRCWFDKSFDQLAKLTQVTSLRYLYSKEDTVSCMAGDLRWAIYHDRVQLFFGLETFGCRPDVRYLLHAPGPHHTCDSELAHPYQGSVVVSAQPLRYALSRMDDMDKVAFGGLNRNWQDPGI